MVHDIILLLIGLALIVAGGNYVTEGSVTVARRLKVSGLVIGLTVVAFGSSLPDLVVCLTSTIRHKSELALGDVVGADIFDLLLAVGITALVKPIPIDKGTLRIDLPLVVFSALVLFFCADDLLIDGTPNIITRSDALIMLLCFAIFMVYTFVSSRQPDLTPQSASSGSTSAPAPLPGKKQLWLAAFYIVGGLAALIFGGQWIVDGASGIAVKAGMSEAMVGLTIVAIGSSVPDIATSVIAAVKNQPGIALGNIVGACIFDILFALGVSGLISPLEAQNITYVDFATLTGASVLVWFFALRGKPRSINRWEGAVLTLLYCGYMTYLVLTA